MSVESVKNSALQHANQLLRDKRWNEALGAYARLAQSSPHLQKLVEGNIAYLLRNAQRAAQSRWSMDMVSQTLEPRLSTKPNNLFIPEIQHLIERRAVGVATIPARINGLRQVLESLTEQIDEFHVFLNEYPAIPDWLSSWPKVSLYHSQSCGRLGDVGKFFGYTQTKAPWYFTCDDDIVYPPDYAERMINAYRFHRGPVGVHGSLFRYPQFGYYDRNDRHVLHFKWKSQVDRRVHILGTGTMLLDRRQIPNLPRFGFPNMADIWIARFMAEQAIPLHAIRRPDAWLKEANVQGDSIYTRNLLEKTDQRIIVEKEVRLIAEVIRPVKGIRPKVLLGIKTFNRQKYLKECVDSLVRTVCQDRFEVVIAVADDGSVDGTKDYLRQLNIPFEFHVIYNERVYVSGQFNALVRLGQSLSVDFYVIVDDDVYFKKAGWLGGYYDATRVSGFHHLCHFNLPHFQEICKRTGEGFPPPRRVHKQFPLEAHVSVSRAMGALFTLTPEVVDCVGFADEVNFFVRGGWHGDYSGRCCRAGFNEQERFWDWRDSNEYLELQNGRDENYCSAIEWESDDFKRASTPQERQRRDLVRRMGRRVKITMHEAVNGSLISADQARAEPPTTINEVFEKVFVINLDRRPDRMVGMVRRLERCGITYERFSAVDGSAAETQEMYLQYAASRPKPRQAARLTTREFYFGGRTDSDRVAHVESVVGGPAIRSAGALAYLLTYRNILRRCIEEGIDRVLILDDDCLFHNDFQSCFSLAYAELPRNWKLFQLGTMQYDWPLVEPYSERLYLPRGVLVASHAVGLHADTYAPLLDGIARNSLPFDIGPLQDCARLFTDSSFICNPNLIIQDQSESDINSSDVAKSEASKAQNIYKWDLKLYD